MAYDISALKTDLQGVLHGTTNNQITGLNNLINRAARQVLIDCDPNETIRTVPITNAVFQDINYYAAPSDLKGNRIIDIFPQVNRQNTEIWQPIYNQYFDLLKNTTIKDLLTVEWNGGTKSLYLASPSLTAPQFLNTCDSITDNGTWAVGGNASSLTVDNVNFVNESGSLKFNLSAGSNPSTGYLENSTMTSVDISAWLNQGTLFLWTYLPTGSDFSNINLRWGSSSSNYYSVNATVNQQGNSFINGWNLLQFAWLGATVTGSPSPTTINYLRVTWTYNGTAETAVRLDQISAALGTILNIQYYSKYLFRDSSTLAFQETVTADTNLINLDTESFNLLTYKVAELAVQQQQGLDAMFYDGPYFTNLYQQELNRYISLYKSQVKKITQPYYKLPRPAQPILPVRRSF